MSQEVSTRNQLYSSAMLVLSNLGPVAGVLILKWDVFTLLLLYWLENVVIGILHVFRMAVALLANSSYASLALIPFFLFHYGLFTVAHGLFILYVFGAERFGDLEYAELAPGPYFATIWARLPDGVALPFALLAASHVFSFVWNYIRGEEYRQTSDKLMVQPYARVMLLHATLLAGGFGLQLLKAKPIAIAVLALLKIGIDLRAHLREHRKRQQQPRPRAGITQ
jgi:hypothetical protein